DTELKGKTPQEILQRVTGILSSSLDDCEVSYGDMAITVKHSDGMELQFLPTIRMDNGNLKIPASKESANDWSKVNPEAFNKALTKANNELSGKLIPVIKLVKSI